MNDDYETGVNTYNRLKKDLYLNKILDEPEQRPRYILYKA
jgi:hypothetical protein